MIIIYERNQPNNILYIGEDFDKITDEIKSVINDIHGDIDLDFLLCNYTMNEIHSDNNSGVQIIENNGVLEVNLVQADNLKGIKEDKITQSKQELALYLQNNPLQFTDGKFYSVTKEKQTLLANALQVYQMKVQAGLPATLKWNATGEECTEWTLEELTALALAIAEYVEPLVTHQQALEVQIRNATTLEELEGIEISYEMV